MLYDTVSIEREAIESTYTGKMKVTRRQMVESTTNYSTIFVETVVYEDKACALSKDRLVKANQNSDVSDIEYTLKLFCAPEIDIKSGDRIEVTQDGMQYILKHTGEPFKYPTHQEFIVERKEKA